MMYRSTAAGTRPSIDSPSATRRRMSVAEMPQVRSGQDHEPVRTIREVL